MRRFTALLVALLLASAARSGAETVFVRAGLNEGQGWMFPYGRSCWVATVSHVVTKRTNVVIVREGGLQHSIPESEQNVDPDLHIALLRFPAMSPNDCPPSSSGEDNEQTTLERAANERIPVTMERRSAQSAGQRGVSYGIESISVRLRARSDESDNRRTFAVEPLRLGRDEIRKSDSGAPILFQGSGIGEASLPLGLIDSVLGTAAIVVRFDRVREFAERIEVPQRASQPQPFSIVAFTGTTPDIACGPENIQRFHESMLRCGWIVHSQRPGQITLTLYLGDAPQLVSGVTVRFSPRSTPREYSVRTAEDAGPNAHWTTAHDCMRRSGSTEWTCSLGKRPARSVSLIVNGTFAEIQEIRVLPFREVR